MTVEKANRESAGVDSSVPVPEGTPAPPAPEPRWDAGAPPWVRLAAGGKSVLDQPGLRSVVPTARCLFCGDESLLVSWGDDYDDTGRVEMYCNNSLCDAREMTVLVRRDNAGAAQRADVRALRALDRRNDPQRSTGWTARPLTPIDYPARRTARADNDPFDLTVP